MGQSISQVGPSTQPQGKGGFGGAPTPSQEAQNPMEQPGMGAAMQGKGGMAGMAPTQDPMQQPAMMGGLGAMGSPMTEQKQPFMGSPMESRQPRLGQPNPYSNTTPAMDVLPQQGGPAGGKGQPMMPQGKGQ